LFATDIDVNPIKEIIKHFRRHIRRRRDNMMS